MKRSELLGIPLVLVGHAFVLAVLLGLIFLVLLVRFVTTPLMDLQVQVQRLEQEKTVTVEPSPVPSVVTPTVTTRPVNRVNSPASGSGSVR